MVDETDVLLPLSLQHGRNDGNPGIPPTGGDAPKTLGHQLNVQHPKDHGRSNIRCKATYQGDRCKLPRGHEIGQPTLNTEPQPLHAGSFSVWAGSDVLQGVAVGSRLRFKRNRRVNRKSRELVFSEHQPRNPDGTLAPRKQILGDLEKLEKFYGGK